MSYNSVKDYVKNAESNRNPAVLNSLLESEPGMKELPEITTEDEGKILQVNNGKPSWSDGPSGGGVLVVHDVNDILDKTWQEMYDAPFCVVEKEEDHGDAGIIKQVRCMELIGYTSLPGEDPRFLVNVNGYDNSFVAQSANSYPKIDDEEPPA